jgi:acyl-coenzyme A thioesterase PaaI-like protein
MKTTDIAFVKLTGIKQEEDNLSLEFNDNIQNHINTIHAGAQFTLAETQSGLYLQKLFPELNGKVMPILRDSEIKYKNPLRRK